MHFYTKCVIPITLSAILTMFKNEDYINIVLVRIMCSSKLSLKNTPVEHEESNK